MSARSSANARGHNTLRISPEAVNATLPESSAEVSTTTNVPALESAPPPVVVSLSQTELAAFIDRIQTQVLNSLHSQGLLARVPSLSDAGLSFSHLFFIATHSSRTSFIATHSSRTSFIATHSSRTA
jgi:hypothetical protein